MRRSLSLLTLLAALAQPCPAAALDVAKFGAKGDGKGDDGPAIQAAIDSAPESATLTFPKGTYRVSRTLHVTKPLALRGVDGVTLRLTSAHLPLFSVTADRVTFDTLRLTGFQTNSWILEEDGIIASGVFRPGKPPVFLHNIKITHCVFENFGDAAVMLKYVDGATVSANTILQVVNVGIGLLSVRHATVSENNVRRVTGKGVSGQNAWGIYASRLSTDPGDLISQPRSDTVEISHNTISDVPTWSGIDTHGGNAIAIVGNKVTNTLHGIAAGTSVNHAGARAYAPTNITITDNTLNSGMTDGSRQYGITFTGVADGSDFATGAIGHNLVEGYGQSDSHTVPAINIGASKGLQVSDNTIRHAGAVGIYVLGPNPKLSITGNTILDPWTDAGVTGAAMGIRIDGDDNDVVITGNAILRGDKRAKFTLSGDTGYGLYFTAGKRNTATVRNNQNQAAIPMEDRGHTYGLSR